MSELPNRPIIIDEQPGKKAWCSCGESKNQPYCDGSHSQSSSGKRPVIVDIAEAKKVAWCACRKTGNPPYCDGSHSKA